MEDHISYLHVCDDDLVKEPGHIGDEAPKTPYPGLIIVTVEK
jgi:hypothetical protein